MRSCDVAVIGLGLMGRATLDALPNAGVDALGFDPLGPGATRLVAWLLSGVPALQF